MTFVIFLAYAGGFIGAYYEARKHRGRWRALFEGTTWPWTAAYVVARNAVKVVQEEEAILAAREDRA